MNEPEVVVHALSQRVLAVAVKNLMGEWYALIGPVAGLNHEVEVEEILKQGDKLSERIARCIFGCYGGLPYRG